ncbi:MAG: tol-pal system-associated acyl-CoA thioesterase [Gammaproteobacteria bacterium]|nr:tol-pal system-associated acyl-CoA thioesterase [Gammaproteobacteria bacterium]
MSEFIWPVRVYYEDTDSGGVVYHSNYLKFMERARTEWLRSMHLEQDDIVNEYGILFVIHSLAINYLKPALFNDALLVKTSVQKLTKASIVFQQFIVRQDDDGKEQVLTQGTVKVVSLGVEQKKPVPLPEAVYDQFAH